jgi:hypothetical protein
MFRRRSHPKIVYYIYANITKQKYTNFEILLVSSIWDKEYSTTPNLNPYTMDNESVQ